MPHVVLEGADLRGLIYAIYSFSDLFLDVPPLWFWSDWQPARRDFLEIPRDTQRLFPPAQVRWRAWFNNDTDFLTPWRALSPSHEQAMYETILRLKYNTYEVGSVADFRSGAAPYSPHPDAAKAHERGLAITHHHTSPLGSNLRNWEAYWRRQVPAEPPPPLSVRDTGRIAAFWRYHAETAQRAGFEQVWTLVFRGGRDIPYWETYPDAPKDPAERARILGDMLRAQAALVKEVTGDANAPMRTTLYNEGSTLFAAGLLRLPEDPSLIWNFVAARRDHFPAEDLRGFRAPEGRRLGYYLNFQFTSTGSHLAAAEGPWKMAANYRTVEAVGGRPPAFTVVNAGNIREHLAELSANAAMMWGFGDFEAGEFLRRFCARYYGPEAADRCAALYRDFYYAYWCQRPADIAGFERQYIFQDLRYLRAMEMLLKDMAAGIRRPNPLDGHALDNPDKGSVGYFRVQPAPGDANQVAALLRGTAEAREKFASVASRAAALLPEIRTQGRLFLRTNLQAQATLMMHLNALLHETAVAYRAEGAERRERLAAALRALDGAQAVLDSTRHGAFESWYDVPKRDTSRFGREASLRRQLRALTSHTQ